MRHIVTGHVLEVSMIDDGKSVPYDSGARNGLRTDWDHVHPRQHSARSGWSSR
jgi:hypothetical protein